MGFSILASSNCRQNIFVRLFGLATFLLPIFLPSFLSEKISDTLSQGGNTIVFLLSTVLSFVLIYVCLLYFQRRYFRNNHKFVIFSSISMVVLFVIIKATSSTKLIAKRIHSVFHLNSLPEVLQIIFVGMEIGILAGLVAVPILILGRLILDKIALQEKTKK